MTTPPVLPIVPAPLEATARPGMPFRLAGARVVCSPPARPVGVGLAEGLGAAASAPIPVVPDHEVPDHDGRPGAIMLHLDPATTPPGGHRLTVDTGRVDLTAPDVAGLRHAAATLVQLAHPSARTIPQAVVVDAPRFAWRGLSLDVARHFHDVQAVTAVLDVMADLKLNVLHLHLTDDQGWRLEIPSRPLLTERSAATAVGGDPGGFYSTEDYSTIQAHAAERGVVVVPEVDLPGHVNAALHAYGELTPSGDPAPPYLGTEVGLSRLHADLPATAPFVRDVIADLAAMTAGEYLHIGGDEAPGLPDAEYAALVGLAADAVRTAGRTVVGWQEAARATLPPGSIVQYWDERADADLVTDAARAGARVLLSPATRTYLDMKYDATTPLGLEWAGHVGLRDAYEWEPLDVLPRVPAEAVVGLEAALWSETIRTREDLFSMLLPRLAAFAEVAWSAPERRDWDDFAARVRVAAARWTARGLPWHRAPGVAW